MLKYINKASEGDCISERTVKQRSIKESQEQNGYGQL